MNRLIVLGLIALVLAYGGFEARRLLAGPELTIISPRNDSATSSATVTVVGTAHNIAFLTINGAQAYTDEAGHFSLTFSPPPGYTVVTVAASDRFGRHTAQSVAFTAVTYCPV